MDLYLASSLECSKLITRKYSTSFSIGIQLLNKKYHNGIYGIYSFVRIADEIVDTFYEYNRNELLNSFINETFTSINNKISTNPVLNSFQWVVNKYQIEDELIHAFFNSMSMDLNTHSYDRNSYDRYIYGSAEVVGLMCLRVFCENNNEEYLQLVEPAKKLGQAFQKINFLRDIQSDFKQKQRVYFPDMNFDNFSLEDKKNIEKEIKINFDEALPGILKLNKNIRFGVFVAYIYYKALFNKIRKVKPDTIINARIRISNIHKIALIIKAYFNLLKYGH